MTTQIEYPYPPAKQVVDQIGLDPNDVLATIRRLLTLAMNTQDSAERLISLAGAGDQFEKLDVWLSSNGEFPEAWKCHTASHMRHSVPVNRR